MASPPPSPPPPSSGRLPKKPHSPFPEQPSTTQRIPSKSHSNSICKTLIVLLLLLLIPLFPSQAPDFINQTIITQFWEIIHLLFIGIAVSYGLFGRKTAPDFEISVNDDDGADDSRAYLSGISHLSAAFEDGFGNVCSGTDGQDLMQGNYYANYANCQCSGDQILGKNVANVRSFVLRKNGGEDLCDGDVKNVMKNQCWSSKYSKTEPLVVVSSGEHFLGESSDFKPLNLPVRSLRSNVVDDDEPELQNESDSSPKIESKGKNDVRVQKARGVVPTNLEKRFDEFDGSSFIPWRSRSVRMENEGEVSDIKARAHCRPHSVGEFEFERINKSRSSKDSAFSGSPEMARSKVESVEGEKRINKSRSSKGSTFSGSPEMARSKVESVEGEKRINKSRSSKGTTFSGSPEMARSRVESVEGENVISVPRPKIAPLDDEASFGSSRARAFNHCEDDNVGKGKQPIEKLDSDTKFSAVAKNVPSRPKSVRTIKPGRFVTNRNEQRSSRVEASSFLKRGKREETENAPIKYRDEEIIERLFSMPKPKPNVPDFFNDEKEDDVEQNVLESEEDRDRASELNKSSDEEEDEEEEEDGAKSNIDYDLGSEVDRKAGEFIAKFREQIRRQKASSVEGYSREFL